MAPFRSAILSLGAIGAALSSALCCVGPLLLAVTGLGGGALFARTVPFRPHLLVLSSILLAAAFYATYRKKPDPACGARCPEQRPSARQKVFLFLATAAVVAAAADFIL